MVGSKAILDSVQSRLKDASISWEETFMKQTIRFSARVFAIRAFVALALVLGVAIASAPASAAEVKVRFTLDWVAQAPHGLFFISLYEGYYKAEGIDVTFDPGKGSADAVRRIVSGAYDMGFPDINSLIQYNSKNPDKMIQEVMMGYEQPPFSIVTMKKSNITHPKQLVGKSLGAPVFDASYKLFPAFAKAIGIDPNAVIKKNMDPRLREPMLIRGEVDSISGHIFSSMLGLKAGGVKEEEIRYFMYGDYGMDSYANGIAVSPKFMKEHPDTVKAFLRATIKGAREMILHPEKAVAAAKRFEPLLNEAIERDRMRLALNCCILTPNVKKHGYGGVDMKRLENSIKQAALAFGLKWQPKASDMFNASFLPPASERMVHK
jgi:NitT/TauT family transport system substrate-binding protein